MQNNLKRRFFGNLNNVENNNCKLAFQYVGVGDYFKHDEKVYMKINEEIAVLISETQVKDIETTFSSDTLVQPVIVDFYFNGK